jgi:hypothetical protein
MAPGELAALYLTGGSSLMPAVHRRLTALLGRPPETLHDPKLVVALGALEVAPTGPPAAEQHSPPVEEVTRRPPVATPPRPAKEVASAPPRPEGRSRARKPRTAEVLTADSLLEGLRRDAAGRASGIHPLNTIRGPRYKVWLCDPAGQLGRKSLVDHFLRRVEGEFPADILVRRKNLFCLVPHTVSTLAQWLAAPSVLEPDNFVGAVVVGPRHAIIDARIPWIRGVREQTGPRVHVQSDDPETLVKVLRSCLQEGRS